ncbi:cytochrome P450 [Pisolithus microcarpus]|nr:cytochrome P450 [Pisolithus microcarpus]
MPLIAWQSVPTVETNDILQWLIDEKQESSTRQLTLRMLSINLASIHTSSRALYNLAAYLQYVGPLREEVDAIIREHGWTIEAIALMRKAASFLVETQRLEGILTPMTDLTLSDGTCIPEGTHLSVPTCVFHRVSAVYDNPDVFNPLRFS